MGRDRKQKNAQPGLTSGTSDAEAGGTSLERRQEIDRELAALDSMYERGLIPDTQYRKRRSELEAERAELINHK